MIRPCVKNVYGSSDDNSPEYADCLYGQGEDYLGLNQPQQAKGSFNQAAEEYEKCGEQAKAENARRQANSL
jgi:hypothetical protein